MSRAVSFFLLAFFALLPIGWGQEAKSLLLDANVRPEIILPSQPSPAEKYAAAELSTYLGKILSIEIPTREGEDQRTSGSLPIFLGWQAANADLKPEAMKTEEAVVDIQTDRIRIVGGRGVGADQTVLHDRGSLYGAYDLLNELGVRWFRPEPWGEVLPPSSFFKLAVGKRHSNPVYKYRYGMNIYQTFYPRRDTMTPEEKKLNEGEWAMVETWGIRNRQNTNLRDAKERGGCYRINFAHAYQYLVPHEIYFKTHPEYFALINGKRSSDPRAQLCVSNPEVQEIAYRSLRKAMRNTPQQEIFSVGPNDGHLWCECKACKAMDDPKLMSAHTGKISLSNRVVAFANLLAEKLQAEFPHQRLGWYAYSAETEAPTKVKKLMPNTAVMIVAFAGRFSDYSRGLYDSSSPQNALFRQTLADWKAMAAESGSELLTHDYWAFYLWPGPLPVIHTMTDRLRIYHRDFNIVGQYNETHPCWGPQGMGYYFYTWLLRNPDADVEAEKAIYYAGYYGPAEQSMRAYHEELENAARKGPYFGSGGFQIENLFTQELLDRIAPMIQQALRETEGKAPYDRRVQGVAAGFEYASRFRRFLTLRAEGKIREALKEIDDLAAYFRSFEDGSVFDVRSSNRGTMMTIFDGYRKEVDKAAAVFALFDNPKMVQHFQKNWRFQTDPNDEGLERNWHATTDDTDWPHIEAGKAWQQQGYPQFQGVAWYRRELTPPALVPGKRLILWFEAVDGSATVYLNGKAIKDHPLGPKGEGYDDPFYVDITDLLKPGEPHQLAVRVRKDSAFGGITRNVSIFRVDDIRAPVE